MPEPILIAFYSHKGGVGKSTSVHNIATILSKEHNQKVMVVDADPQASVSSLFLASTVRHTQGEPHESQIQEYIDKNYNERNIYHCFHPLDESFESGNLEQNLTQIRENFEPISPDSDNPNLSLIVGSRKIHQLEPALITAVQSSRLYKLYEGLNASITYTIREIAKKSGVEIVLMDLNPGASIFNASVLMGCDYFTVPVMPDHFSRQAIWSLANVIPDWQEKFSSIRANQASPQPSLRRFPHQMPKFLGVIQQRIKFKNKKVIRAYGRWLEDIQTAVINSLYPALNRIGMVSDQFKLFPKILVPWVGRELTKGEGFGSALYQVANTENLLGKSAQRHYEEVIFSLASNFSREHRKQKLTEKLFPQADMRRKLHDEGKSVRDFRVSGIIRQHPWFESNEKLHASLMRHKKDDNFTCKAIEDCLLIPFDQLAVSAYATKPYLQDYLKFWQALANWFSRIYATILNHQSLSQIEKEHINNSRPDFSQKNYIDIIQELESSVEQLNQLRRADNEKLLTWYHQCVDKMKAHLNEHIYATREKFKMIEDFYQEYIDGWIFSPVGCFNLESNDPKSPSLFQSLVNSGSYRIEIYNSTTRDPESSICENSFGSSTAHASKTHKFIIAGDGYVLYEQEGNPSTAKLPENAEAASSSRIQSQDLYHIRWQTASEVNKPSRDIETKVIAFFNFKGGVCKTTTCVNMAHQLVKAKKRVLIIDSDTQCNLSDFLMGEFFYHFHLEQNKNSTKLNQSSDSALWIKQSYELLEEVQNNTDLPGTLQDVAVFKTSYPGLYLLPSSTIKATETEFQISKLLKEQENSTLPRLANSLNFPRMLGKLFGMDFVLIDMSPSLSATNQLLFMASDHFIVPTLADYLSYQAICSLPAIIKSWAAELYTFILKNTGRRPVPNLAFRVPKFAQVFPNRFRVRNGQPISIHQQYIDLIYLFLQKNNGSDCFAKSLANSPIPSRYNNLESGQQLLEFNNTLATCIDDFPLARLTGVPDHNSTGLWAQSLGKPITAFTHGSFDEIDIEKPGAKQVENIIRGFIEGYNQAVNDLLRLTHPPSIEPPPASAAYDPSRSPLRFFADPNFSDLPEPDMPNGLPAVASSSSSAQDQPPNASASSSAFFNLPNPNAGAMVPAARPLESDASEEGENSEPAVKRSRSSQSLDWTDY